MGNSALLASEDVLSDQLASNPYRTSVSLVAMLSDFAYSKALQ
jgi:hypothetical protein